MAGYGFRCRNDNTTYQIDAVHPTYVLRRKAVITLAGGYSQNDLSAIVGRTTDTGINQVSGDMMFVNTSGWHAVVPTAATNNHRIYQPPGSPSVQATVYVFNTVTNAPQPSSTHGLRIRNTAGQIIFESGWNLCKIKGAFNFDSSSAASWGQTFDRPVAVAGFSPYVRYNNTREYLQYFEMYFRVEGNSVYMQEQHSYSYDEPATWANGTSQGSNFIVVCDTRLL